MPFCGTSTDPGDRIFRVWPNHPGRSYGVGPDDEQRSLGCSQHGWGAVSSGCSQHGVQSAWGACARADFQAYGRSHRKKPRRYLVCFVSLTEENWTWKIMVIEDLLLLPDFQSESKAEEKSGPLS